MAETIMIVEFIFGLGLFINALLFVPQIISLLRYKDSKELSLLTFGGFNLIQFFTILHGLINKDYILTAGYAFSFVTCATVTLLIVYYRVKNKSI